MHTLLGTNMSPHQGIFEDDVPFPKVGYVSSLEGICFCVSLLLEHMYNHHPHSSLP